MKKINKVSEYILSQHKKRYSFKNLEDPYILKNENEAYEVQFDFQKNAKRGKIGGYKIALASKVQQQLCSINNPIAGGIFKSEIYQSQEIIKLKNYQSLGLEFEIAFEIKKEEKLNTFKFKEDFLIKNFNNKFEESNLEKIKKENTTNLIINRLISQISQM